MTLSFKADENAEHRLLIKAYPTGRVWADKSNTDTDFGKLVLALSKEFFASASFVEKIARELDINQTIDLIERWETSVGIPDECFTGQESLVTRRLNILQKISDFGGVQTAPEFIDLAALYGFSITISQIGSSFVFPLPFPINFFDGDGRAARHTMIVTLPITSSVFPLPFPLNFASTSGSILECIFPLLAPANVEIRFRFA